MVFQAKLDRDLIIRLHDRGMTVKAIADKLGYDQRHLGKKLVQWGIRVAKHQRSKADKEAHAIANIARSGNYCAFRLSKMFGVAVEEIYEICNLRKIELPPPPPDVIGFDEESTLQPCRPTTARPGTLEKVAVLRRRAANRQHLWHEDDPAFDGWMPTPEWQHRREATLNRNRA